ncbi:ketosteroid isomerase-like protein [Nonomuraea thailandensis]|uniref:Ketosteroid isomerase-like protein n=1 Tax=Nonomuraea thailandensis TaxID=1188745 RepID=A0A9X2GDX7_9ACTN|nr:nuclear transport factor 2 family protein [Nonomuraea thailandensis]MCP2353581.1 ketosteroid isomerase-like protein [Nonomuraea thailandensis]
MLRELAEQLFQRLAADDLQTAAALFAPSVDFSIPGAPGIPWIPQADSPAGMLEFFSRLPTHLDRKKFEISKVRADTEDVVVLGHLISQGPHHRAGHRQSFRAPPQCAGRTDLSLPPV